MAWIRSESGLPRHPKTLHLMKLMGIQLDQTIGRLHLLWWWCQEYAIDGDLSKKGGKVIEQSCNIPLKMLIKAGFIDSRPYRRIHGWWENQGAYLRSRYHKQPEIWQRIEKLYERGLDISPDESKTYPRIGAVRRTDVQTNGRTDVQDVRTDVRESSASRPAPGGASATRENMGEKWQADTKENLNEIATPEEVKKIMEDFRKSQRPGGSR